MLRLPTLQTLKNLGNLSFATFLASYFTCFVQSPSAIASISDSTRARPIRITDNIANPKQADAFLTILKQNLSEDGLINPQTELSLKELAGALNISLSDSTIPDVNYIQRIAIELKTNERLKEHMQIIKEKIAKNQFNWSSQNLQTAIQKALCSNSQLNGDLAEAYLRILAYMAEKPDAEINNINDYILRELSRRALEAIGFRFSNLNL